MNENQKKHDELLDTTDCLEAIEVFKAVKNFLFAVAILCLLLLQTAFWLADLNLIKMEEQGGKEVTSAEVAVPLGPAVRLAAPAKMPGKAGKVEEKEKIEANAKEAARELMGPSEVLLEEKRQEAEAQEKAGPRFTVKFVYVAWVIKFCNYVLLAAAVLYCLTLMFSLKVSLLGRLGGINHISRAFFFSLFMLIFLLPWQKLFGGITAGAMYTPEELLSSATVKACDIGVLNAILYYLRFVGLWVVVVWLLMCAQSRTGRWSRATLKRLEVI